MDAPLYTLLVEDNPEDAQLTRLTLEQAGMRVTTARSLSEARRALRLGSYEVLLVDLRLPDGDGLDLLTLARERDPQSVAVVLTGYSSTEAAISALRRGAYDFLTKPCPAEVLVAAVRRGAERRRLACALERRSAELQAQKNELDRRVEDSTRQIFLLNERLKRFIVQIMQSNDERSRFLDNVAHELKNPLSVVLGHACHLLDRDLREWTEDELELSLKAIRRNAQGLNALLEELTEMARLSSHKLRLKREPLDAFQLARETVDCFQPQAAALAIKLAAGCDAGPGPAFSGDRLRLSQVLCNLVGNALKFTPSGGRIVVSAAPSGSSVRFTVSDSGPGIAPQALDRIFDRFYQLDTPQQQKGLGLGLEIAKGLVTLHGGTIWAESPPGEGARFHFTIPCVAPEAGPEPESRIPAAGVFS